MDNNIERYRLINNKKINKIRHNVKIIEPTPKRIINQTGGLDAPHGTDALVYSGNTNILIDDAMLSNMTGDAGFITGNTNNDRKKSVENLLSYTNLKRACCLRKGNESTLKLNVRLPISIPDTSLSGFRKDVNAKIQYTDKTIDVPLSMCDQLDDMGTGEKWGPIKSGSSPHRLCDKFYEVYCKNNLEELKKEYGNNVPYEIWTAFKPDCACYGPMDAIKKIAADHGHVPKCYHTKCREKPDVYIDPDSRSGKCDSTICANIANNIVQGNVGGDFRTNIDADMTCGPQIKAKIEEKSQENSAAAAIAGTSTGVVDTTKADTSVTTATGTDLPVINTNDIKKVTATDISENNTPVIDNTNNKIDDTNNMVEPTNTPVQTPQQKVISNTTPVRVINKKAIVIGGAVLLGICLCLCIISIIIFLFLRKGSSDSIDYPQMAYSEQLSPMQSLRTTPSMQRMPFMQNISSMQNMPYMQQ